MTEPRVIAVYADGGVIGRNPSEIGGTWAWCHIGEDDTIIASGSGIIRPADVGLPAITNNLTEYAALVRGIMRLPHGDWDGHIYSDSRITLGRLFEGWKTEGIPEVWTGWAEYYVKRLHHPVQWTLLDGHPTQAQLAAGTGKRGNPVSKWNAWCDKECGRLAKGVGA